MTATVVRGTSNSNSRGSATDRAARRAWLLATYRADVDVLTVVWTPGDTPHLLAVPVGFGAVACRCYRCGRLLIDATLTVDRIVPGCQGGTYRRNNIRPACGPCNSETGGQLSHVRKPRRR